MSVLYFVSGNEGKIAEAESILGFHIKIAKLELEEIQDLDLEKIITRKAELAFSHIHKPLIVDDVAFHVKVWNGFPGPFIKYLREAGGNELLLRMMEREEDREVTLVAMVGFHDGEKIYVFKGEVKCQITNAPRGERGWGFDPIIIPENQNKTFAEMTDEEKNAVSHRRNALDQLKQFLQKNHYSFD